ncbi:MAG: metalloregulator ArsR/SmtB family transcription factor [Gammaproteobacteria bacterium]|nr:metalloregulator ArsR/SmtB family transcription factor [Gammaproteobacteria bacterium]
MALEEKHKVPRLVHPERVADVRERLPDPAEAQDLAEQFKLLSDPARLRMIYVLLQAGEFCVGDLAALSELSESATSHQLRLLRTAGLVSYRKEGRVIYYRLADTHIRMLLDVAAEHYRHTRTS